MGAQHFLNPTSVIEEKLQEVRKFGDRWSFIAQDKGERCAFPVNCSLVDSWDALFCLPFLRHNEATKHVWLWWGRS